MTITTIHGQPLSPSGADESIISLAREILSQAERGEIIGLATIVVQPNHAIATRTRHRDARHFLVAGCHYLLRDLSEEPR